MKFVLLINVKMSTIKIVGILTFISMINAPSECIKPQKNLYYLIFSFERAFEISCSVELNMKSFIIFGPGLAYVHA